MKSKLQADLAELHQRHKRLVDRIRSQPDMDDETIRYLLAEEHEAYRQALHDRMRGATPRQEVGCFAAFLLVLGSFLLILAFIFIFALPVIIAGLVSAGFAVTGGLAFVAFAIIYLGERLAVRNQSKTGQTRAPEPVQAPSNTSLIQAERSPRAPPFQS
jgi:hypothetical protein